MIDRIKKVGNFSVNCIERVVDFIIYPPAKCLDWMARKWIGHEIAERDSFITFLETALAEQRSSIAKYIKENNALSERLEKYEKYGEDNLILQKEWLAKESNRINSLLSEQIQNNEKLNESNAKMRAAGDAVAELVALNKPKKHLTKKDKQIQKAVDDWNKNSR
jgi:hypothetical protein